MNINEQVILALSSLDVPVAFQVYKGKASLYITFFTYLTQPEQFTDDEESVLGGYVQVDVWSKGDSADLVLQIHALLKEKGFRWKTTAELYEDDLKIYHTSSRYLFEYSPVGIE